LRRPAPSEPIRRPADPPLEQARASEPPASGPQHVGPHHSEPQWPIADGASPQDELERAKARIERQASIETALHKRELIASFLEVLDDLDRALDAARAAGDAEALTRGVEMVRASFIAKLAQHGVVPADVLGEPFAPQRHEALASVPVRDPAERGHVVGVIRAGYTIDGDLLRPAGVAVGS
jgi:molecular chaperone GrpE